MPKNRNQIPFKSLAAFLITLAIVGCSSKESAPPAEHKTPTAPEARDESAVAPASEEKAAAPVFEGPGALLPKTVSPFALSGNPRYFGPENLYDLINGGAEIYVAFGLKRMVTADYAAKSHEGITVTAEIYDMATPTNAFGRFARFLKGKTDIAEVGKGLPEALAGQGLMGTSNASFWKGSHLVNLTLLDESPTATMESIGARTRELLPGFAEAVAKQLPGELGLPGLLPRFPEEGRAARSEAYDVKRLAGIEGLGAGFSAGYGTGDEAYVLFVTDETDTPDKLVQAVTGAAKAESKTHLARAVGNRVIGYAAASAGWTGKDSAKATRQVDALEKALQEK